ncbi:MAG: site-2 protease family protein [Clostridia bacterium]|nr:site-2 protease family protein [Clostridia bacterium]
MNFDVFEYILRIPIILLSLTVHEVAHGYAAYKLGDPTAKSMGRLSLNPLKHVDPIGALSMLLFRIGWAKPVPINTRYFKKPRRDMALSALAGPVSNLLMAFVAYIISAYIVRFGSYNSYFDVYATGGKLAYILFLFFYTFFSLNISLAVFNLLPIPPLDGSRILLVFLPDKIYFGIMKYEQIIQLVLFACLWMGWLDGVLSAVLHLFVTAFNFVIQFLPFL